LRESISKVRQTLLFRIDAWVLLPDHLHTIWTLPDDDARYAAR
jgi:putative transposase